MHWTQGVGSTLVQPTNDETKDTKTTNTPKLNIILSINTISLPH
jgi:hypothetical protein